MIWRRWARLALGAGAICWALGGEWVSIRGHVPENHLVDVLTGLAFLAGGIVALDRRPGNFFGVLLLAFGFTWYLRNWGDGGLPLLVLLGTISGFAGPPLLAQIMLAYPTGRLRSGFDRVVVALIYAAAAAACAVALLTFGAGSARGCVRCQWEPALFPTKAAYQEFAAIYVPASLALAVLVVLAVRRRWRRATRAERRDLASWWLALRLVGAAFVLGVFGSPLPDGNSFPYLLWELQSLLLAGLPAVLVWGLLSARLARSAVSDLVLELGRPLPPGELGESLARAIGDPSVELRFRRDGQDGWVDVTGKPAALPLEDRYPARAVTIVERDSGPLAALVHDPALDSGLVRAAAAAAGMAIENERLQAEVRAQLAEVRASRQRIVEAGDRERRRVERNLHDGAQQRLAAIALSLAMLRDGARADPRMEVALTEVSVELRQAIAELRELARGIHPAVLTEEGLASAVESLAERSPVPVRVAAGFDSRLPEPVETAAYFVVAESLANVAKHARASSAQVELARCDGMLRVVVADDGVGGADLERGTGLLGLEDRVSAVRGSFRVETSPGGGTRVVAEIPCGQ